MVRTQGVRLGGLWDSRAAIERSGARGVVSPDRGGGRPVDHRSFLDGCCDRRVVPQMKEAIKSMMNWRPLKDRWQSVRRAKPVAAMGFFSQLQSALNAIWDVRDCLSRCVDWRGSECGVVPCRKLLNQRVLAMEWHGLRVWRRGELRRDPLVGLLFCPDPIVRRRVHPSLRAAPAIASSLPRMRSGSTRRNACVNADPKRESGLSRPATWSAGHMCRIDCQFVQHPVQPHRAARQFIGLALGLRAPASAVEDGRPALQSS